MATEFRGHGINPDVLDRMNRSVEIDVAEAVRLAVEAEREECAKLAETDNWIPEHEMNYGHGQLVATAIRSRSRSPKTGA